MSRRSTVDAAESGLSADADAMRRAAWEMRAADDDVAALQAAAAHPFLPSEEQLRQAEEAVSEAKIAREELGRARRRALGALMSGTGMVILVGTLSWGVHWFLVPVILAAITAFDLRAVRQSTREGSVRAVRHLTGVGVSGPAGLADLRSARANADAAATRLVAARRRQDEARAAWNRLAPGRQPSEVETIIAGRMAGAERATPTPSGLPSSALPDPPGTAAVPSGEARQ